MSCSGYSILVNMTNDVIACKQNFRLHAFFFWNLNVLHKCFVANKLSAPSVAFSFLCLSLSSALHLSLPTCSNFTHANVILTISAAAESTRSSSSFASHSSNVFVYYSKLRRQRFPCAISRCRFCCSSFSLLGFFHYSFLSGTEEEPARVISLQRTLWNHRAILFWQAWRQRVKTSRQKTPSSSVIHTATSTSHQIFCQKSLFVDAIQTKKMEKEGPHVSVQFMEKPVIMISSSCKMTERASSMALERHSTKTD